MALGSKNKGNFSGNLFILKVKTKDADSQPVSPFFQVMKKVDGKWTEHSTVTEVSGDISKLEVKEEEFEGNPYTVVNLYLNDGEDSYLVDLRMTYLTRSLFNSLLSLTGFDNVSIGLYQTRPRESDGKVFPAFALRRNDEMVRWKYQKDELPEIKQLVLNKKKVTDTSEIDDFYVKQLGELAQKIGSPAPTEAPTPVTKPARKSKKDKTETVGATVPDDDIPF